MDDQFKELRDLIIGRFDVLNGRMDEVNERLNGPMDEMK